MNSPEGKRSNKELRYCLLERIRPNKVLPKTYDELGYEQRDSNKETVDSIMVRLCLF